MKTIIVATDYSKGSLNALHYAAALAKRIQAKLMLYHVVEIPLPIAEMAVDFASEEEVIAKHLIQLDTLGRDIYESYYVPVTSYASTAPMEKELAQIVVKYGAHMVVMSLPRQTVIETWLGGGTIGSFIRKATYPLLLIPEKVSFQLPVHMLLACDFSDTRHLEKLSVLKEMATDLAATLQVLHIEQSTDEVEERRLHNAVRLDNLLQGTPHEYGFIQQSDVVSGIERAVEQQQANLLAMMPHKHSFWDRLLNGSTTQKIAFSTAIPLLILPE